MVNLQSSGFSENFQTFILTVTDYVVPALVLVDYVFQSSKWPSFCPLSKCTIWPQGTAGWRKLVRADSVWASETGLARSREARFACPNRRACSLANSSWSCLWCLVFRWFPISVPQFRAHVKVPVNKAVILCIIVIDSSPLWGYPVYLQVTQA